MLPSRIQWQPVWWRKPPRKQAAALHILAIRRYADDHAFLVFLALQRLICSPQLVRKKALGGVCGLNNLGRSSLRFLVTHTPIAGQSVASRAVLAQGGMILSALRKTLPVASSALQSCAIIHQRVRIEINLPDMPATSAAHFANVDRQRQRPAGAALY